MVKILTKCPKCNQEVEYFLKRKLRDPFLKCPLCQQLFIKKDLPPNVEYKVKHEESDKEEIKVSGKEETKIEKKPSSLFEETKEPTEIIAEILIDWGCDEEFVRRVTDYINMKGYYDPSWLMNMLLRAKTGRRFTEQEAFMVVDMITSALEREKQKVEETGKVFPFTIMTLKPSLPSTYISTPHTFTPMKEYTPSTLPITTTTPPSIQLPIQPQYQPQPIRTEDIAKIIDEKIRNVLSEKKTIDTIEELKKTIVEQEKKIIELKHEQEKRAEDIKKEMLKEFKTMLEEIKASLTPPQPIRTEEITKKDIELMIEQLRREEMEKRHELEKRLLEEKFKSIEEKIEKTKPMPVSPEGWQKDETRLVAELGSRLFDIIKERKPIEYLVRVIPTQQPTQQPTPQKTEKTLVDLIKESGGVVE